MEALDAGDARRIGDLSSLPRSCSWRLPFHHGQIPTNDRAMRPTTVYKPSRAQVIRTLNLNLKVSSVLHFRRMTPTCLSIITPQRPNVSV